MALYVCGGQIYAMVCVCGGCVQWVCVWKVCVCVCVGQVYAVVCMCGGQRITLWSKFFFQSFFQSYLSSEGEIV